MKNILILLVSCFVLFGCKTKVEINQEQEATIAAYHDNSGRDDMLSGGVKMIPIESPIGTFKVWTKRTGNNPTKKVLLLHGGPGGTHEYFEIFDSYFPGESIEYYYYDQLGSLRSDQPNDPSLLDLARYVEEVEQVRIALGLNSDNFYLLGHSWGGMLAAEYALKYQHNIKGLIISNMMMSIPAYNIYAHDVLMPTMDQDVLAEVVKFEADEDYSNPRYMELLMEHHYILHVLRMPLNEWPEPVNRGFSHTNPAVYVPMQGPSELGASGILVEWDRMADLKNITVPTLVIRGMHDTMDPDHMAWVATALQNGRLLTCENGSHMSMYDDSATYFKGLVQFINDVDSGDFLK